MMSYVRGGLSEISGGWMGRFFRAMCTDSRRCAAGAYLGGLLDADPRKSVRAIAERTSDLAYHQLHHFMNSEAVNDQMILNEVANYSKSRFGNHQGYLVVEDVVIAKRGHKSSGVAVQPCNSAGKKLSCQIVVSLSMVRGGRVTPLAMHLTQPRTMSTSSKHQTDVGVPSRDKSAFAKSEIVISEIERLHKACGGFDVVIVDLQHCGSPRFSRALKNLKIKWIVRVPNDQMVRIARSVDGTGGASDLTLDEETCGAALVQCSAHWKSPHRHFASYAKWPLQAGRTRVSLKEDTIWKNVYVASDPVQLVVEKHHRGETQSYISNMHVASDIHYVVSAMQNYWLVQRAYSRMGEEFGLTKFEGRSQHGLQRHLLMVTIAYLYSVHRYDDEVIRRYATI